MQRRTRRNRTSGSPANSQPMRIPSMALLSSTPSRTTLSSLRGDGGELYQIHRGCKAKVKRPEGEMKFRFQILSVQRRQSAANIVHPSTVSVPDRPRQEGVRHPPGAPVDQQAARGAAVPRHALHAPRRHTGPARAPLRHRSR